MLRRNIRSLELYIFKRDAWIKIKGLRKYRRQQRAIRRMNKMKALISKPDMV